MVLNSLCAEEILANLVRLNYQKYTKVYDQWENNFCRPHDFCSHGPQPNSAFKATFSIITRFYHRLQRNSWFKWRTSRQTECNCSHQTTCNERLLLTNAIDKLVIKEKFLHETIKKPARAQYRPPVPTLRQQFFGSSNFCHFGLAQLCWWCDHTGLWLRDEQSW